MKTQFKIKGLKELNKELKRLPEDFRNKSLNNAVLHAAKVPMLEAIILAPKDSGNLASAIRVSKRKTHSKWLSKYSVNVKSRGKITVLGRGKKKRSNSTYYALMVEEGHRTSKGGGKGKIAPSPFMRPAFERKKDESVRVFAARLEKRITFFNNKIKRLRK